MKKILLVSLIVTMIFVCVGCVHKVDHENNENEYFRAIICWGSNGVEKFDVSDYIRIDDALTTVTSTNGVVYYVHPMNLLMIQKPKK